MNLFILLELLIKSALLLVGAAVLSTALPRISAARRHTLWLAAFVALLLLPCTKLVTPHWRLPGSPAALVPIEVTTGITASPELPASASSPANARGEFQPAPWILGGWVLGVVLVLSYRFIGGWQVLRLVNRTPVLTDPRALGLARQAAREVGLRDTGTARLSSEIPVPCVAGILKPVLLLPGAALDWPESRLLAALRHEFAHVQRRDCLTRAIAWLACACYWPNPLVWQAAHRLALSQEHACDDLVLQSGTPPEDYATLLVETARASIRPIPVFAATVTMAQPSTLEGRVLAIVDSQRDRRPSPAPVTLLGGAFVLASISLSALAQVAPPPAPQPLAKEPPASRSRLVELKAKQIILPRVEFRDATLLQCVEFFRQKSRELDPEKKGLNVVLLPTGSDARITLSLADVPLYDALLYVATAAKLRLVIDHSTLFLSPPATPTPKPLVETAASRKAQELILPSVVFRDTSLRDALDFLQAKAREVDPAKKGVNVILLAKDNQASITINLMNVPFSEALRYISELAGVKLRADANSLIVE